MGDAPRAAQSYREALEIAPAQPAQFFNSLGVAQALSGDEAAARASFERALELAPRQPDAYDNLAQLELRRGAVEQACALYERALVLDVDAAILYNAGMAFAEAGRMREAASALDRAWSEDGADPDVAFRLARVLAELGEGVRAAEMLEAAARLGHEEAQRELAGH
jgi:tetratricopeptide (TPR) repeat protein